MSSLVGSLPDAVACDLMLFMSLRSCEFMGNRTHQNISKTELIYHPEKSFSISCLQTTLVFCGLCSQHAGTLQCCSCSICCRSIKHTRLIADSTAIWPHLRKRLVWFEFDSAWDAQASPEHPQHQLFSTSWRAAQSQNLHPFVVRPIFALCGLFLTPFLHNLRTLLEGRGFTTGLGSMNCCVVLSQPTILFRSPQVGMSSGTQTRGKQSRIHNLFPHLTPAAGSSPTFICSKTGGVWG